MEMFRNFLFDEPLEKAPKEPIDMENDGHIVDFDDGENCDCKKSCPSCSFGGEDKEGDEGQDDEFDFNV